jgi:hypothetical protein
MSLGKKLNKGKLDEYENERAEYYKNLIPSFENQIKDHIAKGKKPPVTIYIRHYSPPNWLMATLPPKKESIKLWKKWAKDNDLKLKFGGGYYDITAWTRRWWHF